MILYHGSNVLVKEPKIIKSEKGRDFGFAFYLTPIKEQAERMAIRKVKQYRSGKPIVNVFEWNENNSGLIYKELKNPNKEWLEMVVKCRSDLNYNHGYDIVTGKIADDSVGETILFLLDGVIDEDVALERIRFQKVNSQVAFCSEKSLKTLKFINSYEVK